MAMEKKKTRDEESFNDYQTAIAVIMVSGPPELQHPEP